jgi:hypothetical protein
MVAALPWVAAAFTAVSSIQQGQAAKKAGDYNAAVATRNAGIAREQAAADAEALQRHVNKVMGASRATIAASGVTFEGSPLDVLAASAGAGEMDRQALLYKGELRAMGYESDAVLEKSKGDAKSAGGYIDAGAALFGGAYGRRDPTTKPQTGYRVGDYENPGY